MGKVIFGLIIAAIIWLLFFGKRRLTKKNADTADSIATPKKIKSEQMVACVNCGVNIPVSEGILIEEGKYRCASNPQCNPHRA
jgi:hypothetical protein